MNKVNEVWRCVYNNADQLYFAKVINDEVIISDGFNIVRRYNISHINGCTYNGDILWLSTEGSNCLLGVDSADNVTYVKVPVEGTVRIFKAASGNKIIWSLIYHVSKNIVMYCLIILKRLL